IGGMGPAATWDFCQRVLKATPAHRDQEHLHILVDCDPGIADRNAAIAGQGPAPGPHLVAMARGLVAAGATRLVMPCNTAHTFARDVKEAVDAPLRDTSDAAVDASLDKNPQLRHVGLLAAAGCIRSKLYQSRLAAKNMEVVTTADALQARLMDLT